MTTRLQNLKREATNAAKWRGHTMRGKWSAASRSTEFYRACATCGAETWVDANPPANGIDISGKAVALNCPIERE